MTRLFSRLFLLLTINFFILPILFGQQRIIDSLRKAYSLENDQFKKTGLYYQIAQEVCENDIALAPRYADTLDMLANSKNEKARALNFRGWICKQNGDFDQAINYYRKDLQMNLDVQDEKGAAKTFADLGFSYAGKYESDSAIANYLKALDIYIHTQDYINIASSYSNIANLYSDQQVHDKAIEYLEKALKIRLEHNDEKRAIYTYNNLATAYGSKDGASAAEIDKALEYAHKGVALANKYENNFAAGVILGGIGHILIEKKRYLEAIENCKKSVDMLTKANRPLNLVYPLANLATAFNALNNPSEALKYAERGYAIMKEKNLIEPLEIYYEELANANEKLGNQAAALDWYKKFMQLDDSLFQTQNVKNLSEIETRYQTEKKEKELIKQKADIFRQKVMINGLSFGIVLLALVGFLLYTRYKHKQKAILDAAIIKEQKLGLNAVIEAQEAERKRIAKDLHDGVAQELVALQFGFQQIQNKLKTIAPGETDQLKFLEKQLRETNTEVRNISHVMMPPGLEVNGLVPSLEMLLRNTTAQTSIKTDFEHYNLPNRLAERVELSLYRITQELLNNTLKHAQASDIVLQLYQAGKYIILRMQDNGISFDFELSKNKGSMGLLNILSRVNVIGGTFSSEKGVPTGTISTVKIPVQ